MKIIKLRGHGFAAKVHTSDSRFTEQNNEATNFNVIADDADCRKAALAFSS